jgi:hypothetical protein
MSLIGLVNLAERLFNQTQGNLNEDAGGSNRPAKAAAQTPQANRSDEFRPSGANAANEAGLFQVTQQSVFASGASVLLVQPSGTTAGGAGATGAAPGNAATGGGAVATPAATSTNTQSADNAQVLAQLQSLNDSLAALGLSADEIAAVDRVAQLIKDFSPAAFASLISQLKVLAQDTTQATGTGANAPTASAANANAASGTGAAQSGGFSIQELAIKFAGINETVQQGGNTLQISAFQLQVSEVNLTLNNAATGQTAQIQAPQAATNATNGTAPLTKAATA